MECLIKALYAIQTSLLLVDIEFVSETDWHRYEHLLSFETAKELPFYKALIMHCTKGSPPGCTIECLAGGTLTETS